MLDAVVSFLWADAAGNEVLLDADGSLNSSFVSNFRPFQLPDGWGIATPTSDADFLGMCRAFGVDGTTTRASRRSSSGARTASSWPRSWTRCYAVAATLTTADAIARARSRDRARAAWCSRRPSSSTTRTRSRSGCSRSTTHPARAGSASPAIPRSSRQTPAHLAGRAPMLGEHTDEVLRRARPRRRSDRRSAREWRNRLTRSAGIEAKRRGSNEGSTPPS